MLCHLLLGASPSGDLPDDFIIPLNLATVFYIFSARRQHNIWQSVYALMKCLPTLLNVGLLTMIANIMCYLNGLHSLM